MKRQFTAVVEQDKETGFYIGIVPGLTGAHTQAASLDELNKNLKEVIELCLEEASPDEGIEIPEVVGTQLVEVQV